MNYYNEHDSKTAAWLRELISRGLIPAGIVDERSIIDVRADELRKYTQCHFFAGIGGWSLALQLAGWPADRPVWTGSCPCQPFSSAGKGLAQADERHLWPVFFDLIRQCRPECVFGEQVASAIGKGWLDGVSADLESEGYACGAAVLGAHSVGSPHIRQRLYWVADAQLQHERSTRSLTTGARDSARLREADRMVLPDRDRCQPGSAATSPAGYGGAAESAGGGAFGLSIAGSERRKRREGAEERSLDHGQDGRWEQGNGASTSLREASLWDAAGLVACRDGKTRRIPTEPAFFPLAHGIPARVVRLRGYGNAIVSQCAAEFIAAYCQA